MQRSTTDGAPLVLLAAGGTGGHLFPAEALAAVLARRAIVVDLVTDERAERYGTAFPARNLHLVASATVRGRDPLSLARTATLLGAGTVQAWRLIGRIRPSAVVGFGGYPTVPPVLAATLRRIPTLIHEQNAVMGRANRLLAARVTAIATGFAGVLAGTPALAVKATRTGNPVRPAVVAAAATPYAAPEAGGPLRLLVFGAGRGRKARARAANATVGRAAGARGRSCASQGRLCAGAGRGRGRAVLRRSSRAHGREPSRGLALRRVDRGRARGDRAGRHPGAAAARA
jgi:UDP-N-acetylglucosamine--N-acetylmuramyl-(pentapeptide) pyrophosphoryl-undecaprenol N-acetylglucosamine transferase